MKSTLRLSTVASMFRDRISTLNLAPHEAMATGAVESGILPLVTMLNQVAGVSTIASCQGHGRTGNWWRPAIVEQLPYVLFRAPPGVARALAQWLQGGRGEPSQLHFCWQLSGYHHPPTYEDMVWTIKLEDCRMPKRWDRGLIDSDIATLANIALGASDTGLTG